MEEIRIAEEDEDDGISLPSDYSNAEKLPFYLNAKEKILEFEKLEKNWNTYHAAQISKPIIKFALDFLRDAYSVLLLHEIDPRPFFVVPTPIGGIQFEVDIDKRELELEIIAPNQFKYLSAEGDIEKEGDASRWQALRLIRWVLTGDKV